MSWWEIVRGTLSAIWSGVKKLKARRAAADLAPGEQLLDTMKQDAAELDRLAEGQVKPDER
ncbi:MAG: hypothetical protein U1A78_40060 [Polyangia bacterium]